MRQVEGFLFRARFYDSERGIQFNRFYSISHNDLLDQKPHWLTALTLATEEIYEENHVSLKSLEEVGSCWILISLDATKQ